MNNVSTVNQLAATHADAICGILDYLQPRVKVPVMIAESSAGDTMTGFDNFKYTEDREAARARKVSLVDLNTEAKYQVIPLIDFDLHIQPVRLAARLLDPDAFVISAGILKTHNTVVATLSVKNMVLGAPLHNAPKETPHWNDKRKYHTGVRQTHYNMLLTAQKLRPYWGVAVLDGFEGMEGNGPASGTPVPSRIAIASTDFIAADRVGVECMGINPAWPGYLNYCGQLGLGNYDMAKIDVIGREDRRRAEEIPDAQGHRARAGVDGRDEGPAAKARLVRRCGAMESASLYNGRLKPAPSHWPHIYLSVGLTTLATLLLELSAHPHLLRRLLLPFRLPGHFDRAVRLGRGRRVFLCGRRAGRAISTSSSDA